MSGKVSQLLCRREISLSVIDELHFDMKFIKKATFCRLLLTFPLRLKPLSELSI